MLAVEPGTTVRMPCKDIRAVLLSWTAARRGGELEVVGGWCCRLRDVRATRNPVLCPETPAHPSIPSCSDFNPTTLTPFPSLLPTSSPSPLPSLSTEAGHLNPAPPLPHRHPCALAPASATNFPALAFQPHEANRERPAASHLSCHIAGASVASGELRFRNLYPYHPVVLGLPDFDMASY